MPLFCSECGEHVVMDRAKHRAFHGNRHVLLQSADLLGTDAPARAFLRQLDDVFGKETRPRRKPRPKTPEAVHWAAIRDAISLRSGLKKSRLFDEGAPHIAPFHRWRRLAYFFALLMAPNRQAMASVVGHHRNTIRNAADRIRLDLRSNRDPFVLEDVHALAGVLGVRKQLKDLGYG